MWLCIVAAAALGAAAIQHKIHWQRASLDSRASVSAANDNLNDLKRRLTEADDRRDFVAGAEITHRMSEATTRLMDAIDRDEAANREARSTRFVRLAGLATLAGVAALGILAFGTARRTARRRKNRCVECNYDLTGNRSGSCPECGKPIATDGKNL